MAAILFHSFTIDDSNLSRLLLSTSARIFRRGAARGRAALSRKPPWRTDRRICRGGKRQAQRPAAARRREGAGQEARKVTLLVANLDRSHHCRHARANRLTLHVLAAAAEHERHMIGERARQALAVRHGTRHQAWQSKA